MRFPFLPKVGVLRGALLAGTVCLIGVGPFVDGEVILTSWRLLLSVVAPALMLIVLFVLPLDMTMARIFMSGADHDDRARLQKIIKIEGALLVAMVLAWVPFVMKVMRPVD